MFLGEKVKPILKWKGVRLNSKACETVTPDSVLELIKNVDVMSVEQPMITRDKRKIVLTSKKLQKQMRVTMNKRMWPRELEDMSLPIGFQQVGEPVDMY